MKFINALVVKLVDTKDLKCTQIIGSTNKLNIFDKIERVVGRMTKCFTTLGVERYKLGTLNEQY